MRHLPAGVLVALIDGISSGLNIYCEQSEPSPELNKKIIYSKFNFSDNASN
jgi:hypothetical protein